jgi:hypothetical protein
MNPKEALWEKGDFTRIAQSQNQSPTPGSTSPPATFLRVTVRA